MLVAMKEFSELAKKLEILEKHQTEMSAQISVGFKSLYTKYKLLIVIISGV